MEKEQEEKEYLYLVEIDATDTLKANKVAALMYKDREEHSYAECSWNFYKIVIPTIVSCLFLQLQFFLNILFAGKLDDSAKLAGVGLGTSLLNVVLFQPIMGMNGALETLASQAYGA